MSHPDWTILDRLHRHAQDQPDRVAFTCLHDDGTADTLSFRQLEQRVHTLAARFAQWVEPGDRALLLYPSGLEFIGVFLGCLYAGITVVPAPIPRKNRSNIRLQSILQDATPRFIF
ncbi:MAG TPA: AMP-binding protein [Candidatus Tectomicrobia bacterium]